jgi:hydroxymethylpyrimidine/phosphomethylpyrimidine kinase
VVSVLTVAGTDPTGRAGVAADFRAFAALGVHGAVAVTSVTVQDAMGVSAIHLVPPRFVAAQIEAAAATGRIAATKTGALGGAGAVAAVARAADGGLLGPLVVDPVLAASGGGRLIDEWGESAIVSELLPRAALVTPNLSEAAALLGRPVETREEMPAAAAAIGEMGAAAVLLKGGHLGGRDSPDLLWHSGVAIWLDAPRVDGPDLGGTGCALSAALAAGLAGGVPLEGACRAAKAYVGGLIARSASAAHFLK